MLCSLRKVCSELQVSLGRCESFFECSEAHLATDATAAALESFDETLPLLPLRNVERSSLCVWAVAAPQRMPVIAPLVMFAMSLFAFLHHKDGDLVFQIW